MAITTGAELATAVANWLGRADLTSRIPEFVSLAEAKFNRTIRTREMEVLDPAFAITGEYVAMPLGFLDWRSGYLNLPTRPAIAYLPADQQAASFQGVASGEYPARYVTVVGTNFQFAPPPSGSTTATIVYRKALDSVAGGGTAINWLLTSHPDVYLYAALMEAAPFLGDDARVALWMGALGQVMRDLKSSDAKGRVANGMQIRAG